MLKTILAIILFGLAFKASGAFADKEPNDVVVVPDGVAAGDDEQPKALPAAENFLVQAEAYIDARPGMRRQHEALLAQLDMLSESDLDGGLQSGQEELAALNELQADKDSDIKS